MRLSCATCIITFVVYERTNVKNNELYIFGLDTAMVSMPSFREMAVYSALAVLECGGDVVCVSKINPHLRPLVARCNPCNLDFDLIIKARNCSILIYFIFLSP